MSKSLKSYGVPSSNSVSTGLTMPTIDAVNFEIKPALISMVSQNQYGGHPSEEPTNHLQRFNQLCGTIKHKGVTQDQLKVMLFGFSLRDKAQTWLNDVKETEWSAISQAFLEEFFPPTKTAEIRHKLTTFTQEPGESLREAWDRFKNTVDFASGGVFLDKEVDAGYDFLANLAANHYSTTRTTSKKGKIDVDAYALLSSQVAALNLKIDSLKAPQSGTPPMSINAMSSVAPVTTSYCEVCGIQGHFGHECSYSLQDTTRMEKVNAFQQRQPDDPYSNSYNPGWRNHSNFSYRSNNAQNPQPQQQWSQS
ncbi:uncharacterized protein [Spinacia oleracea]|uniref:Retrotransposon gag domain-containing protein n=1 Tax=Spinacia oleracea TaxID=3562 RepID=A0ABM3R7Y0_SPIOL|nr:uncharacterized protein LOC110776397 [Spinacia oleracea]